MKRIISISTVIMVMLLVTAMLVSGSMLRVAAETDGDYEYTVQNGEATITKYIGTGTEVVIPATVGEYSVTAIGRLAFQGNANVTSVVIPDSVKIVGEWAFGFCTGLTKVELGSGVEAISYLAFDNCTALKDIVIPDSVKTIGVYAFNNCVSLTSAVLGNGITSIEPNTFNGCTNLANVTISAGVSNINYSAFYGCTSLNNVVIDQGNTKYKVVENCIIETETNTLALALNSASIPVDNGVTSIGAGAFLNRDDLTSVVIPSNIIKINAGAFIECHNIESITVIGGNASYYGKGNCVIDKETQTVVLGCKTSDIPNDGSIKAIGSYAFYSCEGLKNIVIPEGVTTIGAFAFEGCTELTDVVIPTTVTNIGSFAFAECASLKNVKIPEGVTCIYRGTFQLCNSLENVVIPNSIVTIEEFAFDCQNADGNVWYEGESKDAIAISSNNKYLTNATWNLDSCMKNDDTHQHIFDNTCDVDCNNCGKIREITHTYDFVCDDICNVCGIVRDVTHTYDNDCDTTCNVCGQERTITHAFEWVIDTEATCGVDGSKHEECTVCGTKQNENTVIEATGEHVYDNDLDAVCNVCEYERIVYTLGDLDGVEGVTDSDAVYLLFHTYFPEDYPVDQPVDYDGDGSVTDSDAVYLLFHTYFPEDYPLYATTPAMTVMETIETKKDEE